MGKRSVDESVDEGIPEKEPRFDDEEVDLQRVVEESLKKVQGKGKEKVSDEQVARDLLTLQTPKNVSRAEQYIFQRCTPASTEPSGYDESSLIYVALGLTNSALESNEEVPHMVKVEAQDEGQARLNPGVLIRSFVHINTKGSSQVGSLLWGLVVEVVGVCESGGERQGSGRK
nr:hypothetical protein [Tanacetum cinerariifolium]